MLSTLLPVLASLAAATSPITTSAAAPDRVGGPGQAIDRVEAYSTDSFEIAFHGGRPAAILVVGDGDTDLDLFVYDENDNLIASDVRPTDRCLALWTPRWTGVFRVEVRNRGGVFNRYRLTTN